MKATSRMKLSSRSVLAIVVALGVVSATLAAKGKGKPPKDDPPPIAFSIEFLPQNHIPYGMNDLRDVVGYHSEKKGFLRLADGTVLYGNDNDIVDLPPNVTISTFKDVNNLGQIVGRGVYLEERTIFPCRITPGDGENPPVFEDLGSFGGSWGEATAINDSGEVAGTTRNVMEIGRAFIYTDQEGLINLGTLPGGRESRGCAINELGVVAGQSSLTDQGPSHAIRASATQPMQDLGDLWGKTQPLASFGYGINDFGDVVGESNFTSQFTLHAFLYTDLNGMVDLGILGGRFKFVSSCASDINNQGLIVGWS